MATVKDAYIPQQGFNSIFSDIVNCEYVVRPSEKGFKHENFGLKRRGGLFSLEDENENPQWKVDGDIKGGIYNNKKIFFYTDKGTVYSFDGSSITQLASGLTYDSSYSNEPLIANYIGGARFPDDQTTLTVDTYNSGPGSFTVNENIDVSYAGKAIYVKQQNGSNASQRQVRSIDTVDEGSDKISPNAKFDISLNSGDVIWVYDDYAIPQYRFPQLRDDQDDDYIFALDEDGNEHSRYFPNAYKIISFDNRIVHLHKNRSSLLFGDVLSPEIVDLTQLENFGNSRCMNIATYGGYLFTFFEDRIGILKKTVSDSGNVRYQSQGDLLSFGLYSENSFIVYSDNLWVFANDRRLYSINLQVGATGEIVADPKDQGQTLVGFFNRIVDGDVSFSYNFGELRMIHTNNVDQSTDVYKYSPTFQGWTRDEYQFADNLFTFVESIENNDYTCYEDKMYRMAGNKDIDKPIEQKIEFYGPIEGKGSIAKMNIVKFMLGYNTEGIGGKVKIEVGGYTTANFEGDIEDLKIIDIINSYTLGGGSFGSMLFGDYLIGGLPGFGDVEDYVTETLLVTKKIAASGSDFKITLVNDTDKQLVFMGAISIYNTMNAQAPYIKGIF